MITVHAWWCDTKYTFPNILNQNKENIILVMNKTYITISKLKHRTDLIKYPIPKNQIVNLSDSGPYNIRNNTFILRLHFHLVITWMECYSTAIIHYYYAQHSGSTETWLNTCDDIIWKGHLVHQRLTLRDPALTQYIYNPPSHPIPSSLINTGRWVRCRVGARGRAQEEEVGFVPKLWGKLPRAIKAACNSYPLPTTIRVHGCQPTKGWSRCWFHNKATILIKYHLMSGTMYPFTIMGI